MTDWWYHAPTWGDLVRVYLWYVGIWLVLKLAGVLLRRRETPEQRVGRRMGEYGRALRRDVTGR